MSKQQVVKLHKQISRHAPEPSLQIPTQRTKVPKQFHLAICIHLGSSAQISK